MKTGNAFMFPLLKYKEALAIYHESTAFILTVKVQEVIDWFYSHYPKRTIKWNSDMGVNGFLVDGLYLYHYDERLLTKLQPLVALEQEVVEFESSAYGHFIWTGDIGDPVADKMRLGILTPTY